MSFFTYSRGSSYVFKTKPKIVAARCKTKKEKRTMVLRDLILVIYCSYKRFISCSMFTNWVLTLAHLL